MNENRTIIFILSDVRSGSTLLENILSNSPDIVSVGELHHLDSHLNEGRWGKTWDWKCSCGSKFTKCIFWSQVLENLKKKGLKNIQQTAVIKNYGFKFSNRISPLKLSENKNIINTVDNIYESIFELTGKNVIVDSSKEEMQLAALIKYSKFKVKVIFLKRDIRAVVLSKQKWAKKFGQNQTNIFKQLLATKIKYNIQKKTFNKLVQDRDGLKLTYTALANDIPSTLTKIINFIGIKPFNAPTYMEMHNNHSVGGTPNRERRKISYDDSWKKKVAKRPVFRLVGKVMNQL